MAESPGPLIDSGERPSTVAAKRGEVLNSVSTQLLQDLVQQALQKTKAASVVIALGSSTDLICRATAGTALLEIGARISTGSGLTGLCVSSGIMESCLNTELDPRVDFDACRELGIGSMVVAPLFDQDQWLGLIEVFYQRPYAFGMQDLLALQGFTDEFAAKLRRGTASTNGRGAESKATLTLLGEARTVSRFSRWQKIGIYTLAFLVCFLVGLRWGWTALEQKTDLPKGQVTLTSTFPSLPAQLSHAHIVNGTLISSVDPSYPAEALQRQIEGQVVLQVQIGKDGSVHAAKVIRGDPMLSQAALEAVEQWRFTPYKLNDKPLDIRAEITFQFSLAK
ncbi:MAG: TonB family protein [Candidatus Sulfotelmatobacter sp.]